MSTALSDTRARLSKERKFATKHAAHGEIERLQRLMTLQKTLATESDLHGMLQAFSEWLAPTVDHAMLGLVAPDPDAVPLLVPREMADVPQMELLINALSDACQKADSGSVWQASGLGAMFWPVPGCSDLGHFALIRHGIVEDAEIDAINAWLLEIQGALNRALEFGRLHKQARVDALTGLPNRRVIKEAIAAAIETCRRSGRPAALLYMDLDNFKQINDGLGHNVGDELLKAVGDALLAQKRGTDTLARMGGDEFMLLLPDTRPQQAAPLLRRLEKAISRVAGQYAKTARVGLSTGLACWTREDDAASWIDRADKAMYDAKRSRRHAL